MEKQEDPEKIPTLAALRRRRSRKTSEAVQPGLFSGLVDLPESAPELPSTGSVTVPGSLRATTSALLREPSPTGVHATEAPEIEVVESSGLSLPNPEPKPQLWTVSGLVQHVRGMVERGYSRVTVEGEISNWRPSGSGHCYFTLKDAGAQLSAVMFRRQATLLRFRPNDGDAVKIHGQLSVYEGRGQMQLIVAWMQQAGLGALLAAAQLLKERLRREGLFERKRPLPPFPRCIGVITSLQGAALRDIVKVCRRRYAAVQILIYPAAVQGPNCPAEIAAGLRWFNAHPDRAEVVLVARGGGSWEDLHGFDDERVARAIAGCALPVVTGIGHATDSTLADAAADICAPTPSAAAEILTAGQHRIEEHIVRLGNRLLRAGAHEFLRGQQRWTRLGAERVLRRFVDQLNRRAQRIDELTLRSETAIRRRQDLHRKRVDALESRLGKMSPTRQLNEVQRRLEALQLRLAHGISGRLSGDATRVSQGRSRLEAMSPLRVLDRGYALVYGPDNSLLRAADAVGEGEQITARLASGSLRARVLSP